MHGMGVTKASCISASVDDTIYFAKLSVISFNSNVFSNVSDFAEVPSDF